FLPWQQHSRLDTHERGDKQDEFTRKLNVQRFLLVNVVEEIVRDARDRNIVNIQLIPFNEEEEKVERTLELRQLYLVRSIIHFNYLTCKKIRIPALAGGVKNTAKIPGRAAYFSP